MSSDPFPIVDSRVQETQVLGREHLESEQDRAQQDLKLRIEKVIKAHPIMLFMKGNNQVPQCGFSANTCHILNQLGADYKTFDILQAPEIRQGIKEYSNWPTFPQLYIKGELIGGNDIIMELAESGELGSKVASANKESKSI